MNKGWEQCCKGRLSPLLSKPSSCLATAASIHSLGTAKPSPSLVGISFHITAALTSPPYPGVWSVTELGEATNESEIISPGPEINPKAFQNILEYERPSLASEFQSFSSLFSQLRRRER